MDGLPQIAAATAAAHDMSPAGAPVVAMVSGGADSVALLRWLDGGGFPGSRVSVLHVNHGLRGEAADADARFVERLCETLGVPCRVARYDVAAYAEEADLNLEDAGRRVRYRFAEEQLDARCAEACVEPQHGRIVTAHTFDDRAETLVMRLAQGTGASGLVSPPYRRGRVVRPFLDCTRVDVVAYLGGLGQAWREDATNLDTSRLRARVRSDVIPLLRGINPRFDATLARTLAVLSDEDDLLDTLAAGVEVQHVTLRNGELRVDRASSGLARPLLRRMLRRALFAAFPDASRLEFEHLESACDGIGRDGFSRDLPGRLRAFDEYGTLVISRVVGSAASLAPSLLHVPGTIDLGDAGCLTAEPAGPDGIDPDPASALIDASAVREGLVVDSVRPGDRMRPLGMEGSRKLQDVLTDAKVPARQRPLVPVVRDGERIVWVAGVRMSEEYRVGPGTESAIRLHWTPRSRKRIHT
ncbi:MAG TPA: tRNA lysidine(34) synthetase TilS [Gaiellaceae bacterium]